MEQQNVLPLEDDALDMISGGAINVFDAPPKSTTWWKFTCHACGNAGVVPTYDNAPLTNCVACNSTNIDKAVYQP